MSYLEKLIERATDGNLDLENNQIGNYRITPQHGNVYKYIIYKDGAKNKWYPKKKWDNQHVSTITIDFNKVDVEVDSDYLSRTEISNIIDVINNLYSVNKEINIKNIGY